MCQIMMEWDLENKVISEVNLKKIEERAKKDVSEAKINAKKNSVNETISNIRELNELIKSGINTNNNKISNVELNINKKTGVKIND